MKCNAGYTNIIAEKPVIKPIILLSKNK